MIINDLICKEDKIFLTTDFREKSFEIVVVERKTGIRKKIEFSLYEEGIIFHEEQFDSLNIGIWDFYYYSETISERLKINKFYSHSKARYFEYPKNFFCQEEIPVFYSTIKNELSVNVCLAKKAKEYLYEELTMPIILRSLNYKEKTLEIKLEKNIEVDFIVLSHNGKDRYLDKFIKEESNGKLVVKINFDVLSEGVLSNLEEYKVSLLRISGATCYKYQIKNYKLISGEWKDEEKHLIFAKNSKNDLILRCTNRNKYKDEIRRKIKGQIFVKNISRMEEKLIFEFERNYLEEAQEVSFLIVPRKNRENETSLEVNLISFKSLEVSIGGIIEKLDIENNIYDFYFQIIRNNVLELRRIFFNKLDKLESLTYNEELSLVFYRTTNNDLSGILDNEERYYGRREYDIRLNFLEERKEVLSFSFELNHKEKKEFEVKRVFIRKRVSDTLKEIEVPFNQIMNEIRVEIDVKKLILEPLYWDFYVEVEKDGIRALKRIENPDKSIVAEPYGKTGEKSYDFNDDYFLYTYFAMGKGGLTLCYRIKDEYESDNYRFKEKVAIFLYRLFRFYYDRKKIWLIYEKFSSTAQDNSYYFYRYCREKKLNNVYYILRDGSEATEKFEKKDKNLIKYYSLKHLIYIVAARYFISSESKGHAHLIRTRASKIREIIQRKKFIFLQHGVIGFKKVDIFKKSSINRLDLFITSSELEKSFIVNDLGYNDNEVIVTGLSRWDELKDKSRMDNKNILVFPTWRTWLEEMPAEAFENSDYCRAYKSLLLDKELEKKCRESNVKVKLFLHPKFEEYAEIFDLKNSFVELIKPGTVEVRELLMECSMLVTDYSSVAWDVYHQEKPVVFYQFDSENYNKIQGSYMDLETELFGRRATEEKNLITHLKYYIDNNFSEEHIYKDLRKSYLKYTDTKNTERIYDEILKLDKKLYSKKYFFVKRLYWKLRNKIKMLQF